MKTNDDNDRKPYELPNEDFSKSYADARSDKTSDLVRAVLERARAEKRGAGTPTEQNSSRNVAPLSNGSTPDIRDAQATSNIADSVRRVLNQYRQDKSAQFGENASSVSDVLPREREEENAPEVSYASSSVPLSESTTMADDMPVVETNLNEDDLLIDADSKESSSKSARRERVRPRKAKKEKREKKKNDEKNRELDYAASGLGALVGAGVGTSAAIEPKAFFTNQAALVASAVNRSNSFELGALTIGSRPVAPEKADAFLQDLSLKTVPAEENESAKEQIEFLNDCSSLERAVKNAPMWLVSLLFHLAVVLILVFVAINTDFRKAMQVISEPGFSDNVVIDEVFDPDMNVETTDSVELESENIDVQSDVVADAPDVSAFNEETAQTLTVTDASLGLDAATLGDVENLLGSLTGDDLSGRGENKAALVALGGGSEGSEKSVALALAWLAEHQLPDGSWTFKIGACPTCQGNCTQAGTKDAPYAATAMAILPFLAAGNTPTKGKYKQVVSAGLNYLTNHGKVDEHGLSFHESGGTMYSHGLATIALCETYAMLSSKEKKRYQELGYLAQSALAYIEYAQASDGGWRYNPRQAGDTSVFGWQMMALKSGMLAGLSVNNSVVLNARSFLRDVVATDNESKYKYEPAGTFTPSTNAIGLLCRLYLDWGIDEPKLTKGVENVASFHDSHFDDPYFMYYASQLLYNHGGEVWDEWNRKTRDTLIKRQCMEGHERGSWSPKENFGHNDEGGRLYATALYCMVLEVYYRHMPIYQKIEKNDNFPLDVPIN